jgi:hypothetical protein
MNHVSIHASMNSAASPAPLVLVGYRILQSRRVYAHLPNTLISTSPATSANIAHAVLTIPALNSLPCIQSLASISTIPTHAKIPADRASSVPIATMVLGSLPLNLLSTPMPMPIPMGVMSAKIPAMMHFCIVDAAALGSSAMQVPSAIPSNIWWKRMTTKRVTKKVSPATTSVMPMTVML